MVNSVRIITYYSMHIQYSSIIYMHLYTVDVLFTTVQYMNNYSDSSINRGRDDLQFIIFYWAPKDILIVANIFNYYIFYLGSICCNVQLLILYLYQGK